MSSLVMCNVCEIPNADRSRQEASWVQRVFPDKIIICKTCYESMKARLKPGVLIPIHTPMLHHQHDEILHYLRFMGDRLRGKVPAHEAKKSLLTLLDTVKAHFRYGESLMRDRNAEMLGINVVEHKAKHRSFEDRIGLLLDTHGWDNYEEILRLIRDLHEHASSE